MKNHGNKLGVISAMALVAALPGRKLTKEFLESEVKMVEFNHFGETNTHCTITTKSGFVFTGESACVDPTNYDEDIGNKIAYDNAFGKMWMPYGFWLHKALAEQPKSDDLPTVSAANPTVDSQEHHEQPTMDFGYAVKMMKKEGKRVSRIGWNGKGMWLRLAESPTKTEYRIDGEVFGFLPYIQMKTADDKIVPWLASQTDVLAEDWVITD